MTALKVEDVKAFTSKLFVKEEFDSFLVKEVTIVTYNVFSIDGHIRQGYYTEEELEEKRIEEFSSWSMLRPVCFSLIKGKKLPGSFRIVLQLPPQNVEKFAKSAGAGIDGSQIQGLYLNIRYEDGCIILHNRYFTELFYNGQDTGTGMGSGCEKFYAFTWIVCTEDS